MRAHEYALALFKHDATNAKVSRQQIRARALSQCAIFLEDFGFVGIQVVHGKEYRRKT